MLSYQHAYHAGNMADVHKHAILSFVLDYLVQKPKPLSYMESHAGRGLYDLSGAEALKTGEAVAGIARVQDRFPPDHPYMRALGAIRDTAGADAYPGSPLIARTLLRGEDTITLGEMHPQEVAALRHGLDLSSGTQSLDSLVGIVDNKDVIRNSKTAGNCMQKLFSSEKTRISWFADYFSVRNRVRHPFRAVLDRFEGVI